MINILFYLFHNYQIKDVALVGANSMTIEDVDKDQKNEIIINAQWLPEGKTKVVEEQIVLKLTRGCAANEYCDAVLTREK